MGRNNGYRRSDYRLQMEKTGGMGAVGGGGSSDGSSRGQPNVDHPIKDTNEISGMLSGLEKRLTGVQQDFTQAIHKTSEKGNEKFDLIFAILSELQQRQAHLEESVRSLKAQHVAGQMVQNGNSQPQQQPQFGQMSGQMSQMNGHMGAPVSGDISNQQPMQQFTGVMQPDGTVMMQQMPQQMIIMSPPTNGGGMQYTAIPQMMAPAGAVMQQVPVQMMQFSGQSGGPEITPEMGMTFVNGQENCQPSGNAIQVQMDMIGKTDGWRPEVSTLKGAAPISKEQGAAENGQQDSSEAPTQSPVQSGIGSSETSSQEGKVDDGSMT
jgi:hypothetical protein